jgi:hypothetical protein
MEVNISSRYGILAEYPFVGLMDEQAEHRHDAAVDKKHETKQPINRLIIDNSTLAFLVFV